MIDFTKIYQLTEVAGEGGPDLAPQKFLSSQKFRHLMGWRNMRKKKFLPCLVSEIQLFVYIFGWISKWPPEVRKGSLVKFFEVSYYQKNFQPPTVHNSEDRGGMKMPYDFLFTFVTFSKQTAGLEKKSYSLEWPAYHDKRVERPNIYVSWTGTKLGPQTCFVNKQLTDISKKLSCPWFLTWFWTG